jgi:hypothetical protein
MTPPRLLRVFPQILLCLIALAFLSAATFKRALKEPTSEGRRPSMTGSCDTLFDSGVLRNLCHAYCDAMGCGTSEPSTSPQACTTVRNRFIALSSGIHPPCPDTDTDLVPDDEDNCLSLYNPDQLDTDQDSVGDVCDNCVLERNADQANRDQDALGDACDTVDNPIVSDAQVQGGGINLSCSVFTDLCCVDPPLCSCCCLWFQEQSLTGNARTLSAYARVHSVPGAPPIQSVVWKFADPPLSLLPPGSQPHEVSFELFDAGPEPLGYVQVDGFPFPIGSGDETAGDGRFARVIFMEDASHNNVDVESCANKTMSNSFPYAFTTYHSPVSLVPPQFVDYRFRIEARDAAGNVGVSQEILYYITAGVVQPTTTQLPCGAPTGAGGCAFP